MVLYQHWTNSSGVLLMKEPVTLRKLFIMCHIPYVFCQCLAGSMIPMLTEFVKMHFRYIELQVGIVCCACLLRNRAISFTERQRAKAVFCKSNELRFIWQCVSRHLLCTAISRQMKSRPSLDWFQVDCIVFFIKYISATVALLFFFLTSTFSEGSWQASVSWGDSATVPSPNCKCSWTLRSKWLSRSIWFRSLSLQRPDMAILTSLKSRYWCICDTKNGKSFRSLKAFMPEWHVKNKDIVHTESYHRVEQNRVVWQSYTTEWYKKLFGRLATCHCVHSVLLSRLWLKCQLLHDHRPPGWIRLPKVPLSACCCSSS